MSETGKVIINRQDPYPAYRYLQENAPVHQTREGQWLVTRYADAQQLLQDPRCLHWGQSRNGINKLPPMEAAIANTLFNLSPDSDHPYRKQVMHQLAARSLQIEEDVMDQLATNLIAGLKRRRTFDFISDFAHPFTFGTISRIIGVPEKMRDTFSRIVGGMNGGYLACIDVKSGASIPNGREFTNQLLALIALKKENPGNDLCSTLLHHSDAEANQESFILSMLTLLFYAGHLNMMNFLGNAVLALQEHASMQSILRSSPDLVKNSVDELIRYDSPLQFIMLIAREDLTLRDKFISSGSHLLVAVGAANRDPEVFEKPNQLILGRGVRHLGFGMGAFRCVGARLAQMQGFVGLKNWLQGTARFECISSQLNWRKQPFVQRGPSILPMNVEWHV